MESGVLTRTDFTSSKATTTPVERVPVPELGPGKIAIVRGLSGTERDKYQAELINQRGKHNKVVLDDVSAKLVCKCLIHESGERIFKDHEVSSVGAIRGDVLRRLYDVSARLSGITDDEIEELGKSSPSPSGTSSPSDSPGTSDSQSA